MPNWKIASGFDTHFPSPQIEHPPAGVAGHEFVPGVGSGVLGLDGVGAGGAGGGGAPPSLHSQTSIIEEMPAQLSTISCLPA